MHTHTETTTQCDHHTNSNHTHHITTTQPHIVINNKENHNNPTLII